MRFRSGDVSRSRDGFPIHADFAGTTTTSLLRATTTGAPATRSFSTRRSISGRPADRNTSTGAPSSICRASAPEPPKLNEIVTCGWSFVKSLAITWMTSRKLAATDTVSWLSARASEAEQQMATRSSLRMSGGIESLQGGGRIAAVDLLLAAQSAVNERGCSLYRDFDAHHVAHVAGLLSLAGSRHARLKLEQ